MNTHLQNINVDGFTIINDIYTAGEINTIVSAINNTDTCQITFRRSEDLFAIRQFLKAVPAINAHVFNDKLTSVINNLFGDEYFVVKSIYFDKPGSSNWFVAWHQDLTISVDQKTDLPGYGPWTVKQDQFAVQPPLEILEDNFTIRIHLDEADEHNGALKVVPGSHAKGVCRPDAIDWTLEKDVTCIVKTGGIMLMRPLLLHASGRTTNNKSRKVIHIEFSRSTLPPTLNWSERQV